MSQKTCQTQNLAFGIKATRCGSLVTISKFFSLFINDKRYGKRGRYNLKRMKRIFQVLSIALLCNTVSSYAQNRSVTMTTTFDSLYLANESHWDGSDQSGGFLGENGHWNFSNVYDTAWGGYWASGWSYSNETDVTTTGNQFSSFAGSDVSGLGNYIIGTTSGGLGLTFGMVDGIDFYVTNSTYAAISMRDGDFFGKRFGDSTNASGTVDGTNGEDWFKLTISSYLSGSLQGSEEIYLADYRFSNDSLDYILSSWQHVVLPFNTDSLSFSLSSSDVGTFGMNTPGFFCLDQITAEVATGIPQLKASTLKIYPNPADNQILLDQIDGILEIYEISGSLAMTKTLNGIVPIDISVLKTGVYIANVVQKDQIFTTRLMVTK